MFVVGFGVGCLCVLVIGDGLMWFGMKYWLLLLFDVVFFLMLLLLGECEIVI